MSMQPKIFLSWKVFLSILTKRGGNPFSSGIAYMSLLGISLGVCVIITVMSVMNGFQIEIKERMLNFTPHASIRTAEASQLNNAFFEIFENDPDIQSYSAFSEEDVLILSNEMINPIRLIAYEDREYLVEEKLKTVLVEHDQNLFNQSFRIVIGNDLAQKMNVSIGDKLRLLTSEKVLLPFGSLPRMKDFTVTGIFDSGIFEIDENIAITDMRDANIFLQMNDNARTNLIDRSPGVQPDHQHKSALQPEALQEQFRFQIQCKAVQKSCQWTYLPRQLLVQLTPVQSQPENYAAVPAATHLPATCPV